MLRERGKLAVLTSRAAMAICSKQGGREREQFILQIRAAHGNVRLGVPTSMPQFWAPPVSTLVTLCSPFKNTTGDPLDLCIDRSKHIFLDHLQLEEVTHSCKQIYTWKKCITLKIDSTPKLKHWMENKLGNMWGEFKYETLIDFIGWKCLWNI